MTTSWAPSYSTPTVRRWCSCGAAVFIGRCSVWKERFIGVMSLKVREMNHERCGSPSTSRWVAVMCKPKPASLPMTSTVSSSTKWRRFATLLRMLRSRQTMQYHLAACLDTSGQLTVMTSSNWSTDKQCASDPMPTWLLKTCASDLAPFLCQLFNASLLSGMFPSSFKSAYVTPILKKPGLAEDDAQNYRPISNLSVILKLLERI